MTSCIINQAIKYFAIMMHRYWNYDSKFGHLWHVLGGTWCNGYEILRIFKMEKICFGGPILLLQRIMRNSMHGRPRWDAGNKEIFKRSRPILCSVTTTVHAWTFIDQCVMYMWWSQVLFTWFLYLFLMAYGSSSRKY